MMVREIVDLVSSSFIIRHNRHFAVRANSSPRTFSADSQVAQVIACMRDRIVMVRAM